MRAPKGHPTHKVAPAEWRGVPDLTGSLELDRVISANPSKAMQARLSFYLDRGDNLYGPKTGYSGYHGYSGDD